MAEPLSGAELSQEQLEKVEEFIEEEEGSFNRYRGWLATFLAAVAVLSSAFHLYAAYSIWLTQKVPSIVRPAASVLSGAVGTMFGAMATIFFAMYLQANALEKHAFRATISAMLLALSVVRAIAYVSVGEFSAESMVVFLAALPAMALGIWAGGRIHAKISETAFKRLVCAIVVVCAIP